MKIYPYAIAPLTQKAMLTYMSIAEIMQDEVDRRVSEGALIIHKPLLRGAQPRVVLVEYGFHRELTEAAHSLTEDSFRVGQLFRDFDRFSNGSLIVVGYGKELSCFMKLLDPHSDEVWEIRSRDPKPSWRVFCRFAMPNVLVVLNAAPRDYLAEEGSVQWREAIRDCKTRWRRLFQVNNPFHGESADEYITEHVLVIGDIP